MDDKTSHGPWLWPPRIDEPPHSRRRSRVAALCLGILGLVWLSDIRLGQFNRGPRDMALAAPGYDPMNPWETITPSTELEWHPCYTPISPLFRCARFSVPMDYDGELPSPPDGPAPPDADDVAGARVHLALVLVLPSQLTNHTGKFSANSAATAGRASSTPAPPAAGKFKLKAPLLVNPGGPGGSGVLAALLLGPSIQQVLAGGGDDEADRPVLGFDPRGVSFTTPRADCWATPDAECRRRRRSRGTARWKEVRRHHRSEARVKHWLWGGLFEDREEGGDDRDDNGGGGPGQDCPDDAARGHMHRLEWEAANVGAWGAVGESDAAARFLDAAQRGTNGLCRARDGRVPGGASGLRFAGTRSVARDMAAIVDAWDRWVDREQREEEEEEEGRWWEPAEPELRGRLVYWGFSYGTYLGATFARLFPDKVGRVMLDGVVDAELYETPVWRESLVDADAVLAHFFRYCAAAGSRCDLYRPGDGAEDVRARYEALVAALDARPVVFTHPDHFVPVVLRAGFVRSLVFAILYSPVRGFPALATVLNFLHEGRHDLLAGLFADPELQCALRADPAVNDAQRAIMCSDKTEPVNLTLPEIMAAYDAMAETSQFAGIWMSIMLKCNGWDLSWQPQKQPPRPQQPAVSHQVETAAPLLFLSNTYDPVTPLRAAVKMALQFRGAGLLEQRSLGHCTISAVSRCTARVVREYVRSGRAPPPPELDGGAGQGEYRGRWAHCEADEVPWGSVDASAIEKAAERRSVEAWQRIQSVMEKMRRWDVGGEKGFNVEAVMAALARTT